MHKNICLVAAINLLLLSIGVCAQPVGIIEKSPAMIYDSAHYTNEKLQYDISENSSPLKTDQWLAYLFGWKRCARIALEHDETFCAMSGDGLVIMTINKECTKTKVYKRMNDDSYELGYETPTDVTEQSVGVSYDGLSYATLQKKAFGQTFLCLYRDGTVTKTPIDRYLKLGACSHDLTLVMYDSADPGHQVVFGCQANGMYEIQYMTPENMRDSLWLSNDGSTLVIENKDADQRYRICSRSASGVYQEDYFLPTINDAMNLYALSLDGSVLYFVMDTDTGLYDSVYIRNNNKHYTIGYITMPGDGKGVGRMSLDGSLFAVSSLSTNHTRIYTRSSDGLKYDLRHPDCPFSVSLFNNNGSVIVSLNEHVYMRRIDGSYALRHVLPKNSSLWMSNDGLTFVLNSKLGLVINCPVVQSKELTQDQLGVLYEIYSADRKPNN